MSSILGESITRYQMFIRRGGDVFARNRNADSGTLFFLAILKTVSSACFLFIGHASQA